MPLFDWVSDPQAWIALLSLTILEIVLGIDNIIFISILSGKLPPEDRAKARNLGLAVALISRVLLLLSITWVMGLTATVFSLSFLPTPEARDFNWRDIILGLGGLFLIWKSVKEIHHKLEGGADATATKGKVTLASVVTQIFILDIVFSLDSVITAIGMAKQVGVMIVAVVLAVGFMLVFAGKISEFVEKHPTIKILALSFLILIGVNLVAEATGQHIPKGYTYFAMAFAVIVEMLNLKLRSKSTPIS